MHPIKAGFIYSFYLFLLFTYFTFSFSNTRNIKAILLRYSIKIIIQDFKMTFDGRFSSTFYKHSRKEFLMKKKAKGDPDQCISKV